MLTNSMWCRGALYPKCKCQSFQVSDEYAVTATTFHSQKEGDACGSAVLASIIHFFNNNNVSEPEPSVVAPSSVYL